MSAGEESQGAPAAPEPSSIRRIVAAGLEDLELPVAEDELAVIEVVDSIYRPLMGALLEAELDGVDPEPGADLSRGPQPLEPR
jgi:hypothetical protein